jgi:hypothetical protein
MLIDNFGIISQVEWRENKTAIQHKINILLKPVRMLGADTYDVN